MAGFKTHLTVSTLAGIAYGGAAYSLYGFPPAACVLAGGLCSVSGMLPDIDSDSGKPVRESLSFAAAVVSTMLVDRFRQLGLSTQSIVLAAATAYVVVRFGVGALLKRYTVHRGMFHSLPAAAIAGEIAFLLASGPILLRFFQAGAVVAGYASHLILDELFSVEMKRGRMTAKKSLGTAVKLWSRSWGANLSTYAKLAVISGIVWIDINQPERFNHVTEAWEEQLMDWAEESLLAEAEAERVAPAQTGTDGATASASRGRLTNGSRGSGAEDSRSAFGRFPAAQEAARSTNTRYGPATADDARTFSHSNADATSPSEEAAPPAIASRNREPGSRSNFDRPPPDGHRAASTAGAVEASDDNGAGGPSPPSSAEDAGRAGPPRIRRLEELPEVPAAADSHPSGHRRP